MLSAASAVVVVVTRIAACASVRRGRLGRAAVSLRERLPSVAAAPALLSRFTRCCVAARTRRACCLPDSISFGLLYGDGYTSSSSCYIRESVILVQFWSFLFLMRKNEYKEEM